MQLQKSKTDERTGISYTLIGDYYIPDITLPKSESEQNIGIWGMRHKQYLIENKGVLFNILLTQGKLYSYLADIDHQVEAMFSRLITDLSAKEGITKELKETNQLEWVQKMNNIQNRATEIVNTELIYI